MVEIMQRLPTNQKVVTKLNDPSADLSVLENAVDPKVRAHYMALWGTQQKAACRN